MTERRISKEQFESIGKYHPAAKWLRPFCTYSLSETGGGNYERHCRVSIPAYTVLFIPVHLLEVLVLIWDGGLIQFEIQSRYLGSDHLGYGSKAWEVANEIWEKA